MLVESARTLMRLRAGIAKRLLKESASGASSNFNRHARGSITCCKRLSKLPTGCFLQDLQSTRSKCQIWHCVGKECVMSMFANECVLQDLPALAAKISKCGNFIGHKPVCNIMKRIPGHDRPFSACQILVIKPTLLPEPICI